MRLRRHSRKKIPRPPKIIIATPPTTPPTMAPTGVDLALLVAAGVSDVVVCVSVSTGHRVVVVSKSVTVGIGCDDLPPIVEVWKLGFSSPS